MFIVATKVAQIGHVILLHEDNETYLQLIGKHVLKTRGTYLKTLLKLSFWGALSRNEKDVAIPKKIKLSLTKLCYGNVEKKIMKL